MRETVSTRPKKTTYRYRMLRKVDRARASEWARRGHPVRAVVTCAWVFSAALHLPYFFQYDIVPCAEGYDIGAGEEEEGAVVEEVIANRTGHGDCWTHVYSGTC